ncbi:MAG: aminoacetone oxidase family FAD-binding enzyme [Cardiobacteriaceae bacterium]|nr:aminoacetone oxidase family FAD-binding enzyme [Cardiobacteriaceae bacterium]
MKVIIIGAGAAGIYCAIHAARRGLKVLLLDHNDHIGNKILVSGGGRCNVTNLNTTWEHFISHNPHFPRSALSRHTPYDFLAFLGELGLSTVEKAAGQLFCKERSRALVQALHDELLRAGVDLKLGCAIKALSVTEEGVLVQSALGNWAADKLVIATGAPSFPKLGATSFALSVAKQFKLANYPFRPALVPLVLQEPKSALSGISVRVKISAEGAPVFVDDLLFTHRGLSGPAVLQISSYLDKNQLFVINFLPQSALEDLVAEKESNPRQMLYSVFKKHLPQALVDEMMGQWGIMNQPLQHFSHAKLREIMQRWQGFEVMASGHEGMNKAEVCTGGVNTEEVSPKTFACHRVPRLHFIGECLDVTGHLGGHNLQWAWASGYSCAMFL